MSNVNIPEDTEQTSRPVEEKEIGALEAFWSFFSSMKTAIFLLLLLTVASIAGTILADKKDISIYGTTWFSVILLLVGVNLTVCSINRFGNAWKRTFEPKTEATPERVAGMARSEEIKCTASMESATDKVIGALRSRTYRLVKQSSGETVSIYAAKGRVSIWGPYFTHLSLLVIFAGAIFGNLVGSEGYTTITEGNRTSTYYKKDSQKKTPLGFEVALRNFTIKHDKNHNPIGYKSNLQVYDHGKPATRKVIDVNHPLSYNGISFFQSDYGLVGIVVKVTSPNGETAHIPYNVDSQDSPQGRSYVITDEPWKKFELGGKNLTLFVHDLVPDYIGGKQINGTMLPLNPGVNAMMNDRFPEYKGLEAWQKLGWLTTSVSAKYKGYNVTLEKVVSYTGLQVSRNPGLPAIYLGFALMVLGVFVSFYVTHKVMRVSIAQSKDGGVCVTVGATSRDEPAIFDRDFKRVRDALA